MACLELLFNVLPSDAFSFAEKDEEGELGPRADGGRTSGMWQDASTLVLTTGLDVTGSTRVMLEGDMVTFGEDDETLLQFGTTDYLFTSGLTANGTLTQAQAQAQAQAQPQP